MKTDNLSDWIKKLEINGTSTFSVEEVRSNFPEISEQNLNNSLYRFTLKNKIVSVYKGFYVIIPPHYAAKGIIPPTYYIDQLMQYIGKPYYISLLSAAEFFGAAHQRSQRFFVTTILPSTNVSKAKNKLLSWLFKKEIPEEFLLVKNSETGTIRFSNAELTAIDLVQYENAVGGLSRVATVLDELCEQCDFSKVNDEFLDFTSVATVQRLGYILENILEQKEQANILYEKLIAYGKRLNYIALSTRSKKETTLRDIRWKININSDIETDDIW